MACCGAGRPRDRIYHMHVAGHDRVVAYLNTVGVEGRLAHAYLFVGQTGVGKSTVARAWAQELLAHDGSLRSHPDYYELDPCIPDAPDPIEMARAFTHFMSEKPLLASRKVALILRAEMLTPASCDALLKTIEEPAGESVIIVTVSHQDLVPATIRSRCQIVVFSPAPNEEPLDERHTRLAALLADTSAARFRWVGMQFGTLRDTEEKRTRAQELMVVFERVIHESCRTERAPNGQAVISAIRDTRHALEHNVSPQLAIEHLLLQSNI